MEKNEGLNNLHGGFRGFDMVIVLWANIKYTQFITDTLSFKQPWESEIIDDGVRFTLKSPDGDGIDYFFCFFTLSYLWNCFINT